MAMPQRDDPPTPRLRPALKLRHDKSADKYDPPPLYELSPARFALWRTRWRAS